MTVDNVQITEKEIDSNGVLRLGNPDCQVSPNADLHYELRVRIRLLRRFVNSFRNKNIENKLRTILYITLQDVPYDYISALRKQYPDKEICVLLPIRDVSAHEKLNYDSEVFVQNKINKVGFYRIKNSENVKVYGVYCELFVNCDFSKFQNYIVFLKAARYFAKKINPDVLHSDGIPFFAGSEYEQHFPYSIKVLQVINDFSDYEDNKVGAFWAAVNLLDKKGINRICRDRAIKKYVTQLFYQHNSMQFSRMDEYLEFIYQNYETFRDDFKKSDDTNDSRLFNRLNYRVLKLFPKLKYDSSIYYNLLGTTIKRMDYLAVPSKTYYKELIFASTNSKEKYNYISKLKGRSSYVINGFECPSASLYQNFSLENFREIRVRNKKSLLREFSKSRIRVKFVDSKLFLDKDYQIRGYLDSFYEAPLIFCKFSDDIFKDGASIAIMALLKLFEQYRNVQFIMNIPAGLQNSRIKSLVEFMENNSTFDGRWVFIDGNINLSQFYASSDIALFPSKCNDKCSDLYMSMKFGCIPIVSKNGIYNDVVSDILDDMVEGRGFKSDLSYEDDAQKYQSFYTALDKALNIYTNNSASWKLIIENAMKYNSGWTFERIKKYNDIYESL